MLHGRNFFSGDGTDMTVLGREPVVLTREQLVHNCFIENRPIESHVEPRLHGLINNEPMMLEMPNRSMKAYQCFDSVPAETEFAGQWMSLAPSDIASTSVHVDHSFSLNSSSPMALNLKGRDSILREKTKSTNRTEKLKKRKTEIDMAEDDCKEERLEAEAGEEESEITAKSTNTETSAGTSKENSKVSVIQKPDYIHVRARRGQATDSHSLAERARREKISKKMKCLQDLVPGCNKVAGKAGMLDEIINYVQSLQRQVEFLSMKLAALNPGREINMDYVLMKQFAAYSASFPAATAPSEMTNAAHLQFYRAQGTANSGIDMPIDPTEITTQRTTISSSSIPEAYPDLSSFPQVQSLPNWGNDLQTIYNDFY